MSLNWLFLDLNSYFASVEQAENPELCNKPVAVVPMLADNTCCLAASYPAKAYGIKTGTSIKEARQLCPDIIFVVANHKKYVAYHHKIITVVDTCIPIYKVMSVDEMTCELLGREKIERNAVAIARKIKQTIYSQISPALTCSIGIAPNSYLAKVASDMQKPDGLTVIHTADIPEIFYTLTPRDFPGIGAKMEQRLLLNGCKTVKQMYQLSFASMRQIWGGVVGERFWYLIRGENLPEQATSRRTIGHSRVLAPELRNHQSAYAVCVELLSKAGMRLRQEGYRAQELTLNIKFLTSLRANAYWQSRIKLKESQDTLLFIKLLDQMWSELKQSRRSEKILKVGVTLSRLTNSTSRQLELFSDNHKDILMQTIDQVNNKYQSAKIYVASAQREKDQRNTKERAVASLSSPIAFQHIPKL